MFEAASCGLLFRPLVTCPTRGLAVFDATQVMYIQPSFDTHVCGIGHVVGNVSATCGQAAPRGSTAAAFRCAVFLRTAVRTVVSGPVCVFHCLVSDTRRRKRNCETLRRPLSRRRTQRCLAANVHRLHCSTVHVTVSSLWRPHRTRTRRWHHCVSLQCRRPPQGGAETAACDVA